MCGTQGEGTVYYLTVLHKRHRAHGYKGRGGIRRKGLEVNSEGWRTEGWESVRQFLLPAGHKC